MAGKSKVSFGVSFKDGDRKGSRNKDNVSFTAFDQADGDEKGSFRILNQKEEEAQLDQLYGGAKKKRPLHFRKTFVRYDPNAVETKLEDEFDVLVTEEQFEERLLRRINQFKTEKSEVEITKHIAMASDDKNPEEIKQQLIETMRYRKETTDNGGGLWEKGHFFPAAMKLVNAAKAGRLAELKRLLRQGHAINGTDSQGRSALYWAVRGGPAGSHIEGEMHLRCVKYLLSTCPRTHIKLFLELQTGAHMTALMAAAAEGRSCSVRALIEAGTCIEHKDCRGDTALDWARKNGHREVAEMILKFSMGTQRWHRRDNGGANWNVGKILDEVCIAAMSGDVDKTKALIREGADITVQLQAWKIGSSALYLAARGGIEGGAQELDSHVECVRYLLQACPSKHLDQLLQLEVDSRKFTPIFAAASEGRLRSLTLLLEAGADIAHRDDDGNLAVSWAREHGHKSCVKILNQHARDMKRADLRGTNLNYKETTNLSLDDLPTPP
jgi:hypothetical protein